MDLKNEIKTGRCGAGASDGHYTQIKRTQQSMNFERIATWQYGNCLHGIRSENPRKKNFSA